MNGPEDSNSLYIDEDELGRYGGSGHWEQDGTGVWYAYDTGGYPASCWKQINGAWYYFNNKGYIVTGWQKLDGTWYYLNPSNGIMMTGWQAINGKWYYMNGSGEMQTGWQAINGRWYYLDGQRRNADRLAEVGGQWYYLDPSGAMQTGWQAIMASTTIWAPMEPCIIIHGRRTENMWMVPEPGSKS